MLVLPKRHTSDLDQLDKSSSERFGMNERDPMTSAAGPRFRVDQASSLLLQVR